MAQICRYFASYGMSSSRVMPSHGNVVRLAAADCQRRKPKQHLFSDTPCARTQMMRLSQLRLNLLLTVGLLACVRVAGRDEQTGGGFIQDASRAGMEKIMEGLVKCQSDMMEACPKIESMMADKSEAFPRKARRFIGCFCTVMTMSCSVIDCFISIY